MIELLVFILQFIAYLVGLYVWILIAAVILSWLVNFNVVNPYNNFVRTLGQALAAVTEPVLRPIRRVMPDLGGIDISPIIVLLACYFLQGLIYQVLIPNVSKLA